MKNCSDCPQGTEMHNELVNDISMINAIVTWLNKGAIMQAIEESESLQRRLINRHKTAMGR